jgi:PAS domain S-box-containing protein
VTTAPDPSPPLQPESLLRIAGRLAHVGGWSIDFSPLRTIWSDELAQLFGYPAGYSPDVATAEAMFPPLDRQRFSDAIDACIVSGEPFDLQAHIIDSAGDLRDIRMLGEAVQDEAGRVVRINGAFTDVTAQVAADDARARLEARLTTTLDSISDGIVTLDDTWRITYANPSVAMIMGFDRDTLIGEDFFGVFPVGLGTEFAIGFKRALAEHTTVSVHDYFAPLQRWAEATAYPVDDGLAIYFRDVTEREVARRRLAESEERNAAQAALLDVATDAIVVRTLDDTITYWNHAAEVLYGWSAAEVLGSSKRDLLYPDPSAFDAASAILLVDGSWSGEIEHRHRDGRRIIVEGSWTLVRDEGGRPLSVFSVNTDITARRRIDEQNFRAQRMESIGTLASGIAHDLNNVLTPILISVQLLDRSERDESKRRILATVEASVKRGADMIRQVLSFAKGVDGKRVRVDIGDLLIDLQRMFGDTLPVTITVRINAAPDLWTTRGDSTQLLQVLVNLVTNAKDAMPSGGTLTITARNVVLTDESNVVSHLATPGKYIAIDVEDTGTGMPPDVLTKIFEPFFTTKTSGEGTGLGLATSLGIIRSHGGSLQAYSELRRGSRFQIHLPAISTDDQPAASEVRAADLDNASTMPRGANEMILVVDDEASIRQMTRQSLEAFGYRTLVASNGAEAIEVVESGGQQIDLILTDMTMPVMDGAATAAYFLRTHPTIPIIAASGLNANGGVARAAHSGVRNFLSKPYSTADLLLAVRAAIDADAQPDDTNDEVAHGDH